MQAKAPKLSLDAALPSTTPKPFVARADAPEFVPSAQAHPPRPRETTAKPAANVTATAAAKAAAKPADPTPPKRKQPERSNGPQRTSVFARLELACEDRKGGLEEPAAKRRAGAREGPLGPSRLLVASLHKTGLGDGRRSAQGAAAAPREQGEQRARGERSAAAAREVVTAAASKQTPPSRAPASRAPASKKSNKPASLRDTKALGGGTRSGGNEDGEASKPPTFAGPKSRAQLRQVWACYQNLWLLPIALMCAGARGGSTAVGKGQTSCSGPTELQWRHCSQGCINAACRQGQANSTDQ